MKCLDTKGVNSWKDIRRVVIPDHELVGFKHQFIYQYDSPGGNRVLILYFRKKNSPILLSK